MLKSYIVPQFTCLNHDYTSTLLCCIAVLFSQSNWDSDDDDEEDDDIEAQAAVKTPGVTGVSPRQVNLQQWNKGVDNNCVSYFASCCYNPQLAKQDFRYSCVIAFVFCTCTHTCIVWIWLVCYMFTKTYMYGQLNWVFELMVPHHSLCDEYMYRFVLITKHT